MIILPDKNIPRAKILLPVLRKEWITPSISQPKDQFGNENRTFFQIKARTNDGKICWVGTYQDRDDFDAVLFAIAEGTLKYQKELWPLSTPSWEPWMGEILTYEFATYATLLSPTALNLGTYNKPTDWNNTNNKIECIGGGGGGGASHRGGTACGGGGGSYSQITNFVFPSSSVSYTVGDQSGAVSTGPGTAAASTAGPGGLTFFNATADPGNGSDNTKCSAVGGSGGGASTSTTSNGGAGGLTTASWGQTKFAGGRGGNSTATTKSGTGGGGAGGSTGVGGNGVDNATQNVGSDGGAGGAGDAGVGSAGSAGTGGSSAIAGGGGSGTNLGNGTIGTGGGGGGRYDAVNGVAAGGLGGTYGGAGGGCNNNGAGNNSNTMSIGGNSGQGIIIITYTPSLASGRMIMMFH